MSQQLQHIQQESIRYDRQIRLWGEEGQNSIGKASVCVFGSSALCTEILKSLVLAGVGTIHVIDDAVVDQTDLVGTFLFVLLLLISMKCWCCFKGQNFFITEADIAKPRAEVAVTYLLVGVL